jgi:hypothetical protein
MVPPVVQVLRVPDSTSHGDVDLLILEVVTSPSAPVLCPALAQLLPLLVYHDM